MTRQRDWADILGRGPDNPPPGVEWEWVTDTDATGTVHRFRAPRGWVHPDWQRAKQHKASPSGRAQKDAGTRSRLAEKSTATPAPRTAIPDSLDLFRHGLERYSIVPFLRVDDDARRAAQKMADLAAQELGLPYAPLIVWVAAKGDPGWSPTADTITAPRDCKGFVSDTRPGTVHVRTGLLPEDTAAVVAHETRHIWQQKRLGSLAISYGSDPGPYEADADSFMRHMLARYGIDGG